jgi:nitric oxide reductase subunit B
MELSINKAKFTPKVFILVALILLTAGMLFGTIGGLQYVIPGFLKEALSFEKTRPLHVSSVLFWILFASMGAVLTYLKEHTKRPLYSHDLSRLLFFLFVLSVIAILIAYCLGVFGGREYWEFPPILSAPIILGWIIFLINFVKSVGSLRNQPVYIWMWLTGIVFFLFTFSESYLWLFPYFNNHVVNDMNIQWKSYGSMVGSWNMLIYGSSMYLMTKISGDKSYAHSNKAFILYFAGLFNLMFNWGHHIYTLPTQPYVQYISYSVSMTELLILGNIIYAWKSSLTKAQKFFNRDAFRFLVAADVWIFLNLVLAICMSIPAINIYTHGTHITVAHAMGTTIGINTMLLLAVCYDILKDTCISLDPYQKIMKFGFWLANTALFSFWIALIGAGVLRSKWQMSTNQIAFSLMMQNLTPFFMVFMVSGVLLLIGIVLSIYPLFKNHLACFLTEKNSALN